MAIQYTGFGVRGKAVGLDSARTWRVRTGARLEQRSPLQPFRLQLVPAVKKIDH